MRDMKDEHSRAREEFRVSSRNEAQGWGGVLGCSTGSQGGVGIRVGRDTQPCFTTWLLEVFARRLLF